MERALRAERSGDAIQAFSVLFAGTDSSQLSCSFSINIESISNSRETDENIDLYSRDDDTVVPHVRNAQFPSFPRLRSLVSRIS